MKYCVTQSAALMRVSWTVYSAAKTKAKAVETANACLLWCCLNYGVGNIGLLFKVNGDFL